MAQRLADSAAVSVFCDSVALMLSVGIQTDEAVHMLSEDMGDTSFGKTCNKIYRSLITGKSLAQSMKDTGAFPRYATDMVEVGERSGHLEASITTRNRVCLPRFRRVLATQRHCSAS